MVTLGVLATLTNVLLMFVKIGAGIVGHSYALVADGIESASDILTSLITWVGFHFSLKPADENHPYGHGKFEALAGLFSGLMLFGAALAIGYHSILEIRIPHHAPAWFTLPVLIAVVAIKEFLSRKILSAGKALDSTALKADAWHHRSDAITSGAAAIGITIALVGGKGYEVADAWAALFACIIILFNGGLILKESLHDVLDGNVSAELNHLINEIAASTPGVENTEKCRVRKSGTQFFVEIHVRVDPSITVLEGHRISHLVKTRLMTEHPRIQDVSIHIEPAAPSNL